MDETTPKELDLKGLLCPAPLRELGKALADMPVGAQIRAVATDAGFAADVPAWCSANGHELLDIRSSEAEVVAVVRKGAHPPAESAQPAPPARDKKTMIMFSGDMDKAMAAFIIAVGAASMGAEVTVFFTFWGLNLLRKDAPQARGKSLLDRMFGVMLPKGPKRLGLSKMHMLGLGTAMMKHVMRKKNVDSLADLVDQARGLGVKLVACTMSMDVMGIQREELIDGIEYGGVASFIGESNQANMTLFI